MTGGDSFLLLCDYKANITTSKDDIIPLVNKFSVHLSNIRLNRLNLNKNKNQFLVSIFNIYREIILPHNTDHFESSFY